MGLTSLSTIFNASREPTLLGLFTHGHNPAIVKVGYQGADKKKKKKKNYNTTVKQVKQITHLLTSYVNYEIKYTQY